MHFVLIYQTMFFNKSEELCKLMIKDINEIYKFLIFLINLIVNVGSNRQVVIQISQIS